jgi:hypothetical protein
MANATVTYTILEQTVFGNKKISIVKASITSYGTDGAKIAAGDCGLSNIDYIIPFLVGTGAVANNLESIWWDATNGLLMLYKSSNVAVDGTTNITTSGYIYLFVIGS